MTWKASDSIVDLHCRSRSRIKTSCSSAASSNNWNKLGISDYYTMEAKIKNKSHLGVDFGIQSRLLE